QGYSCCEQNNCSVYYKDNAGSWGVSNNRKWCGIRNTCLNSNKSCPKAITNMGYRCCSKCNVVLKDKSGRWGVENNQWCGISNSCK
ncbi:Non-catalytic module family DOC2, partial [Piromyces sp. E2]